MAVVQLRLVRRGDPMLAIFGSLCGILVLVAIFGGALAPYAPDQTDILAASQGPSAQHLLGTDSLGRDILSRLLVGARLSFAGPALIVVASSVLGTAIALFSAWHGGWVDRLVARVLNVMFAVPGILVAVLAAAIFGAGFWAPVIALSVVYVPYIARVVRSAAVRQRHLPYVEACQLAGLSAWHICTWHLLRNVAPLVVAQATLGFGWALADFGATSFLGLGVQPPQAEWGVMISDGRSDLLTGAVQQSVSAGLAIVLAVVSFNIVGARLSARIGADG
ncbi:peptide/nickel transport system permease protein [Kibdelosporangium banguiense]|uniref:Peptide/nickel transport system permease protein n=1 Tax=Kibdelosporangium banguiense TaxID=1365924 RepID=A0ABS4TRF0_9PSEU|nr:ABC transporter permease [Kibdelosporangium banguiense]MBP2326456.1 peptide/nickel transport system permease protein [Kibdelosporangium banguiense]